MHCLLVFIKNYIIRAWVMNNDQDDQASLLENDHLLPNASHGDEANGILDSDDQRMNTYYGTNNNNDNYQSNNATGVEPQV